MQNDFHPSNSLLIFQKYFIYKVSGLDRSHVSNNLLFCVLVIQTSGALLLFGTHNETDISLEFSSIFNQLNLRKK